MDAQQIKDLIATTIAGQGNQVDSGGKLADILDAIVDLASAGANVQSDWDENDNTDPSFIKNKPTIPAAQVQSDWEQDDAGEVDFIKNKPTIPGILHLTDLPQTGDTAEQLNAKGLSIAAIEKAGNGGYIYVEYNNKFYIISKVLVSGLANQIIFTEIQIEDSGTAIRETVTTYSVNYTLGSPTVIVTTYTNNS